MTTSSVTTSPGKTNAAVIPAQGAGFEVQELDLDGPRDDEVLVRLVATGLCHPDLSLRACAADEGRSRPA